MALQPEGFWVWNPDRNQPEARHMLGWDAVKEAERLAAANPGQQFIVLKAIGAARVKKPATFEFAPGCEGDVEIPF